MFINTYISCIHERHPGKRGRLKFGLKYHLHWKKKRKRNFNKAIQVWTTEKTIHRKWKEIAIKQIKICPSLLTRKEHSKPQIQWKWNSQEHRWTGWNSILVLYQKEAVTPLEELLSSTLLLSWSDVAASMRPLIHRCSKSLGLTFWNSIKLKLHYVYRATTDVQA